MNMEIKVLSENTSCRPEIKNEHGLSLYINACGRNILFDTGASGIFAANAEEMGADLSSADIAVISHGHYDHGGGIRTFLDINDKADIYIREKALEKHYSVMPGGEKKYIGLDPSLARDRFVFTQETFMIGEGLELFSLTDRDDAGPSPSGNAVMFTENRDGFRRDDFSHEQNLVISENGKTLLLAGCAHKGIINIMEKFHLLRGVFPDYAIGGFHLHSRSGDKDEDPAAVEDIARYLLESGTTFWTCHCTGLRSYELLKNVMHDKINRLSAGDELKIQTIKES